MIQEFKEAFIGLILFKRYTYMPRPLEISFSIVAWLNLIIITYVLIKVLLP